MDSNPTASDRRRSVILLSGGLDSSANLAFCSHFDEPVLALTIDYGQAAAKAEIAAAEKIAKQYKVKHQVLDLKWLGALGGSALTGDGKIPILKKDKLDDPKTTQESAKAVWVPNRNGLFINAAASFAEVLGAHQVVVGFNKEEAATFPDNSTQFLNVTNLALRYSTNSKVKIVCYTDMLDKTEIVLALARLPEPFPFSDVWSCYTAGPERCQQCESCLRFQRAVGN